ncbi:hypothetical protein ACS0TY_013226 [Phlomoides rotata]
MAPRKKLKFSGDTECTNYKSSKIAINEREILVVEDDIAVKDEAITESGKTSSRITINRRGRTQMHFLEKLRVKGVKLDIAFNAHGTPIDSTKPAFQSYLGVLVRNKVNINYEH